MLDKNIVEGTIAIPSLSNSEATPRSNASSRKLRIRARNIAPRRSGLPPRNTPAFDSPPAITAR
jgi:hypothetical protein